MLKATYRGEPTKEVRNSCGVGHNQLDRYTVMYVQRCYKQKFKQIFIMEDGREIEGTTDDIKFVKE